jgi:hypothetical protein
VPEGRWFCAACLKTRHDNAKDCNVEAIHHFFMVVLAMQKGPMGKALLRNNKIVVKRSGYRYCHHEGGASIS